MKVIPISVLATATTVLLAQTFDSGPAWMEPELFGFGYSVASCGDMNGDGYDDVIVGGPLWNSGASQQPGAVQIFFGSEIGPSEEPQWFWSGPDVFSTLGDEVAFAGDVNDDGYDDVAFNFGSGMAGGGLYVQLGAPTDYGVWQYDSGAIGGNSIDGGGDVNGDGHDDIVSGFPYSDGDRGRLLAFYGSPTGLPLVPDWEVVGEAGQQLGWGIGFAGDVDGDGYDDVLVCDEKTRFALYRGSPSGLEATSAWTYPQSDSACVVTAIGAAGDLNKDGYDDALVSFLNFVFLGPDETGFHVFLGSAEGLGDEPHQTILGDGDFGMSMASVGDVNGDGYDDIAIGWKEEPGAGLVELFLGSEIGVQPHPAWTNDPVPGSGILGDSVARAGDVNSDGLVDLLVGDPGGGRALVFLGVQLLTAGPGGSIDDASLRVGRDVEGHVVLGWSPSCSAGNEDYVVYRGTLGDFESHDPVTCSTGGLTTWTAAGTGGDHYYLVVPRTLDSEGSYGRDSFASERGPSTSACYPQDIAFCE